MSEHGGGGRKLGTNEENKNNYVHRLMRIRCNHGSMDNYINIEQDHGVLAGEEQQPLMNANDHIAGVNVIHFGNCNSDENPERMFRKSLVGTLLGGPVLGGLVSNVLEDIGIMSFKCTPKTDEVWEQTNDRNILDGAPALLMGSCLTCRYGGTIEFVPLDQYPQSTGQDDSDSEESEEQEADTVKAETDAVLAEAMDRIAATGEEGEAAVLEAQMYMAAAAAGTATEAAHTCNDPEGYFGTTFDYTWAKAIDCPPAQRGENYAHNTSIPFEGVYLDSSGMIINQGEMEEFHINNFTIKLSGCGAIATYNVCKILDSDNVPSFADVIYELEPYGILNNAYGMMPCGIANYFLKRGYDVDYVITGMEEKAREADACVIFYATPKYAHYITCKKVDEENFIFYNQIYGKENDIKTFEEFEGQMEEEGTFAMLGLTISHKKK